MPLPAVSFPLLGRAREVEGLTALLTRDDVKLVTLTGPGGTGKTRLALEVARALAPRFEHGVWFVNLAPLADPALVDSTIAHALGLLQGGRALHDWANQRSLLLVLDCFEAVLPAAPQLAALLAGATRLTVLVTSRARLGLPNEREVPVAPLARDAAVQLFIERAKLADPKFDASAADVAALCERLGNLPLAVELAAARRESLGGVGGGRPQTPRDAIASSAGLLTPAQQQAFARLSVFRGGFTAAAAAALQVKDLGVLVRHNLVTRDGDRFDLPQTVRDYAAELLGEADAAKTSHASYFSRLGAEVGERLERAATAADLDLVEADLDNFRAALGHTMPLRGLELAVDLGRFFDLRGYWAEGRRVLGSFDFPGAPPALLGRALNQAGVIAFRMGDLEASRALHERAEKLGDPRVTLDAVDRLQWCAFYTGRAADGVALSERGWTLAEQLKDPRRMARALGQRAWAAFEQGKREKAEDLYAEAVAQLERLPDKPDLAYMLNALGEAQRGRAHYDEARESYTRCLELAREVGNKRQMAPTLYNLAMVARMKGDRDKAVAFLLEAVQLRQQIGSLQNLPLDLISLANLMALKGKALLAARVLGCAEAMMARTGLKIVFADKEDYDSALGLLRAHLGPKVLDDQRAEGATLTADAAIRLAVDVLRPSTAPAG